MLRIPSRTIVTVLILFAFATIAVNANRSGRAEAEQASALAPVPVSLPNVTVQPGSVVTIPITAGDLTGRGAFSYDVHIAFDPAVIRPAAPAFDAIGTISERMSILTNENPAGILIISAYLTGPPLTGSGTLLNLKFTVVGTPGQSSALRFESWRTGSSQGFFFNEGDPDSTTTNGSVTVGGASISGTVRYGSAAALPISGATVCLGFSTPPVCTGTDQAGRYTLPVTGAGPFQLQVTKTLGQNGISSNDAARIAQHVAGVLTLPDNNRRVAADVTNNGALSSTDAAQIARFVTGLGPPIGMTNQWRFFRPPGPTFPIGSQPNSCEAGQTDCDFVGLLIGEVSGNWANR
ncbi:MAG: cohesin domain-containing protein [Pyrinomonadaceae bacterium]